jgi:hypothetical protein
LRRAAKAAAIVIDFSRRFNRPHLRGSFVGGLFAELVN